MPCARSSKPPPPARDPTCSSISSTDEHAKRREGREVAGTPAKLSAGRVGRPHGLDGSFYVTGARPRLLEIGTSVDVAGLSAAISRRAGTDARPIVRLDGIEDRAAAEALRGS